MDPDHKVGTDCVVDYRWLYLAEVLKTKELRREIEQLHIELLTLKRIQLLSTSGPKTNADSELRSDMTCSTAEDSELQYIAMIDDANISSNRAVDSARAQKAYQRQRIRSTRSQPNRRLVAHNLCLGSAAAVSCDHESATDGLVRGITDSVFNHIRSDDEQTDGTADAVHYIAAAVQGLAAPMEAQVPLTQAQTPAQVQCRSLLWDNDDNDDDDEEEEVGVELPVNICDVTLLMRTKVSERDEGRSQSSIDRQARVQLLRRNARSNNHRKHHHPRSLIASSSTISLEDDMGANAVLPDDTWSKHPGPSNNAADLHEVGNHHHHHHHTINTHRYVSSSDSDEDDTINTSHHHAPQNLPAMADSPLCDDSGLERSTLTSEEELDNHIKRWASGKSIFQMLRSLREVSSHACTRILERAQVLPLVDSLLFSESAATDIRRVYL